MRDLMRLFLTLTLAFGLAGCGLAREAEQKALQQQRQAAYNAEIAAAEADYAAKKITFGQLVSRGADAQMAAVPGDVLTAETAYFAKLQGARVDKGEITIDEYRYAVAQKLSETSGKRQARAAQAMTAAAALNASQPQAMNCTSNRVGTFTYTNCY